MKQIKGFKDGIFFHNWYDQQYSTRIWVLICPNEIKEIIPFMKKLTGEEEMVAEGTLARCSERFIDSKHNVIMAFTSDNSIHARVHECVHAKNFIFGFHGVMLSTDHDEHEAYYVDYLVKNVMAVFDIYEKEKGKKNGKRGKRKSGKKA